MIDKAEYLIWLCISPIFANFVIESSKHEWLGDGG